MADSAVVIATAVLLVGCGRPPGNGQREARPPPAFNLGSVSIQGTGWAFIVMYNIRTSVRDEDAQRAEIPKGLPPAERARALTENSNNGWFDKDRSP